MVQKWCTAEFDAARNVLSRNALRQMERLIIGQVVNAGRSGFNDSSDCARFSDQMAEGEFDKY